MEIRVLGPLEADVDGLPADLGGPRQRAVLALLLTAGGAVVSIDRLVDDLWQGDPPPRAIAALQVYVSHLRRALEPHREPRTPATILVTAAPGYALRLPLESVDAWRFEALVRKGLGNKAMLAEALALWRGPAYAEFADEPWAASATSRLEELRAMARESQVEALIADGAAAQALLDAEALTREYPLRERGWHLLTRALADAGRPGDARAALRRARQTLADELGLDPGAALVDLEKTLLADGIRPTTQEDDDMVGRHTELAVLTGAAETAPPGTVSLALVSGEAGSGKTTLLDRLRASLTASGWQVLPGRCPEVDGAPPGWAWTQVLRALAVIADPGALREVVTPLLVDPIGAAVGTPAEQFRLHEAVTRWLSGGRYAVILDDLHRADIETLALLRSVVELWPPTGERMLLVAAYRPEDTGPELADALEYLARHSPVRVEPAALGPDEIARVLARTCGRPPDPDMVQIVTSRTGGNPFYVRETARLLASAGSRAAAREIPQGIRDVLRSRFARLPEVAVSVLRLAAVQGREVDPDVLLAAAETDENTVLDALDLGVMTHLLATTSGSGLHFTHVLLRDALYADIPGPRRTRWHARTARALEELRPADIPGLANHLYRSMTAATAARTLLVILRAAEIAEARYAYDSAMNLYRQALACLDLQRGEPGERIAVQGRLVQAAMRRGARLAAVRARNDAITVAVRAHSDRLLLDALCAWRIPTPWMTRPYYSYDGILVRHLQRLLDSSLPDDAQRVLLLCQLVRETVGEPGDAGTRAPAYAEQALAKARTTGDPALLGLALCAEADVVLPDDAPARRARIADELIDLAARHDLVLLEAVGHTLARQAAGARNDPTAVRRHLAAEEALSDRFQLGPVQDTVLMGKGMLAAAAGRLDEAETVYAQASRTLARRLGPDGEGLGLIGLLLGRLAHPDRLTVHLTELPQRVAQAPTSADLLALVAVRAGEPRLAHDLRARRPPQPIRRDFMFVLLTSVRAALAVELRARDDAADAYAALRPYDDRLAGASTGSFAMCPVATVLARCAALLGDHATAIRHRQRATEVARVWER